MGKSAINHHFQQLCYLPECIVPNTKMTSQFNLQYVRADRFDNVHAETLRFPVGLQQDCPLDSPLVQALRVNFQLVHRCKWGIPSRGIQPSTFRSFQQYPSVIKAMQLNIHHDQMISEIQIYSYNIQVDIGRQIDRQRQRQRHRQRQIQIQK